MIAIVEVMTCECEPHPIFGHADDCPYKGMGAHPVKPLGPCQLQASPFCTSVATMERLDPMAMAPEDPAPANVIPTCTTCFGARSDAFLAVSAR